MHEEPIICEFKHYEIHGAVKSEEDLNELNDYYAQA